MAYTSYLDVRERELKDGVETFLRASSTQVESDAVDNAPVNSGALRADIKAVVTMRGVTGDAIIGTSLFYSIFQHDGTGIYAINGGRTDVPWVYKNLITGEFRTTSGIKPTLFLLEAAVYNTPFIYQTAYQVLSSLY